MAKQYCVAAVEKAIKILNFLAAHPNSSFSEIFFALGLSKSTTYQTLSTLESFHYVVKEKNKRYSLDLGLLPLLRGIPKRNGLVECAREPLEKLASETGFTVHLCVLTDSHKGICVYKIDGVNFTIRTTEVGKELTFHTSAAGKALLAWQPEDALETYLETIGYTPYTETTITTRADYLEELRKTRERGFSIDNEEGTKGTLGIGIPLISKKGFWGAISIGAIITELKVEEYGQVAKRMYETGSEIIKNMDLSLD